jgi:hypothetical protein
MAAGLTVTDSVFSDFGVCRCGAARSCDCGLRLACA